MAQPEQSGKHQGSRPETNARGQSKLGIAAEQQFLEKSHQQESCRPHQRVSQGGGAGECEALERNVSGKKQDHGRRGLGHKTPHYAFEKSDPESAAHRQAIVRKGSLFECTHDEGGAQHAEQAQAVLQEHRPDT